MNAHSPMAALSADGGGSGAPVLLLLHGLGANAAVWERLRPLLAARWKGRWLAPDLRGHGRSPPAEHYSLGAHAADVAALLDPGEEVVVLGHSMGGAVAMVLGSGWFGIRPRRVFAFGVKLVWSAEEIAKAQALARAPARWFETRADAVERYLRVAGLKGLIDPASPAAGAGICEESGRFRLAADPRGSGVVGVEFGAVVAAMRTPLRLAAGERDPMVTAAQMRAFDRDAIIFPGIGHNPQVEAPEQLWRAAEAVLGSTNA